MRASAALAFALAAGCAGGATALDVTVSFDDAAHHPEAVAVTVQVGGTVRRADAAVTASGGRPLRSGDNFLVLLPDGLGGQSAQVAVDALESGAPTLHGAGAATIVEHASVALALVLGGGA